MSPCFEQTGNAFSSNIYNKMASVIVQGNNTFLKLNELVNLLLFMLKDVVCV